MPYKHLAGILFVLCWINPVFSQTDTDYASGWKQIDQLAENEGRIRSALQLADSIYLVAAKAGHQAQAIRALLYRMRFHERLAEEGSLENLRRIEEELENSGGPARALLHSIAGTMYQQYLRQHRWRLYDRTAVDQSPGEDPSTWSIEDLHQRILAHVLASLEPSDTLMETSLEPFETLLERGNARALRPTLFDLLAHRAIDFLQTEEPGAGGREPYQLQDTMAFAPDALFAGHAFSAADSLWPEHRVLGILQQLTQMHMRENRSAALADLRLRRLQWSYRYSPALRRDSLYVQGLRSMLTGPAEGRAHLMLAEWYRDRGRSYHPFQDTVHRYDLRIAVRHAREATRDSLVSAQAAALLQDLLHPYIALQAEQVNPPGEPLRVLLAYRNLKRVYLRLIRLADPVSHTLGRNQWEPGWWERLAALPPVRSWQADLPGPSDHQLHQVELPVTALNNGTYALLASADSSFSTGDNALGAQLLPVSDIAWLHQENRFYVVDRRKGSPIRGARVQVWEERWDRDGREPRLHLLSRRETDQHGFAELEDNLFSPGRALRIEVATGKDRLFLQEPLYSWRFPYPAQQPVPERRSFLFTDRALYRPGQTVHVKGILLGRIHPDSSTQVLAGEKTVVLLHTANGDLIDSLVAVTNAYGSWSGSFRLPESLLQGTFSLQERVYGGFAGIQVEAYKRPRFYVGWHQPEEQYRLGDTITVRGTATGYAGQPIPGARVRYRVVRSSPHILRPLPAAESTRIWPPYPSRQVQVIAGELTTEANGQFTVQVPLLPDPSVDPRQQPVFSFELMADVTDAAGETRQASQYLLAGYQAIRLQLPLPEAAAADSFRRVTLNILSNTGEPTAAIGAWSIHKLTTPDRPLRARYWEQPDQFLLGPREFRDMFPLDPYAGEDQPSNWEAGEQVWQENFSGTGDSAIALNPPRLQAGWYRVSAWAIDRFGDTARVSREIRIDAGAPAGPFLTASISADRDQASEGEWIRYRLQTNAGNIYPIVSINSRGSRKSGLQRARRGVLEGGFEMPTAGGAVALDLLFVHQNRLYHQSLMIRGAEEDSLVVETISYRDRTRPGAREEWKVRISGLRADRQKAELLAALYDASLDQMAPHRWSLPSLSFGFPWRAPWSGAGNFRGIGGWNRDFREPLPEPRPIQYDRLILLPDMGAPFLSFRSGRLQAMDASAPQAVANMEVMGKEGTTQERAEGDSGEPGQQGTQPGAPPRRNLDETAFFMPQLLTDNSGTLTLVFTMPESLTTWKWMLLAHTPDGAFGYAERKILSSKPFMVLPHTPRFIREKDTLRFTATIVHQGEGLVQGEVNLQLTDPVSGLTLDSLLGHDGRTIPFTLQAGGQRVVSFALQAPPHFLGPVNWEISAHAPSTEPGEGWISDGEAAVLPVISNRKLITATLPLFTEPGQSKRYTFQELLASSRSGTLQHQALVVEYAANPAWFALQALPYLAEQGPENAEALFHRYYANALGLRVLEQSPRLRSILQSWSADSNARVHPLMDHPELKSILIAETPWLLDARAGAEQRAQVLRFLQEPSLRMAMQQTLSRLSQLQTTGGGFVWFAGGRPDRLMTQIILTGIGRLRKLGAIPESDLPQWQQMAARALRYLDSEIAYEARRDSTAGVLYGQKQPTAGQVQYLHARSLFPEEPLPQALKPVWAEYLRRLANGFVALPTRLRALGAQALYRIGDTAGARKILRAIQESAIHHRELGIYWKDATGGYAWHQAPVETQVAVIEAFALISGDEASLSAAKRWLLSHKRTHGWPGTMATADACYALLMRGEDWTVPTAGAALSVGGRVLSAPDGGMAGTGYFRILIPGDSVRPSMGDIRLQVAPSRAAGGRPTWGAVYWQYTEESEKIRPSQNILTVGRALYVEKQTDAGPRLQPAGSPIVLEKGDRVVVRLTLKTDRSLEYVHVRDMRAAGLEPLDTQSGYRWKGGLGYYHQTGESSTDLFLPLLPAGTHVFDYTLMATHGGNFSQGPATVQCHYAPEFSGHTGGLRLQIADR